MPTGDEMFRVLKGLDLGYKAELVLYNLQSILWWTSVLEVILFGVLLVLFFASPARMGCVWLFIPHVARGVFGVIVLKNLPQSGNIIDNLDLEDVPAGQMTVETLSDKIKFSVSVQFMNKGEEIKKWLLLYSMATLVCYVGDGINFVIQYRWFSVPGHEHSELVLLIASIGYFGMDLYYVFWVLMLQNKLPNPMASFVSNAILGLTSKMTKELYQNISKVQRPNISLARKKLSKE